ncbi:MAG: hypothetical protein RR677_11250 [Acinetobacter sp.]
MNLIEQLGLEKSQAIVDGAPETATNFLNEKYYEEWSHNGWVVSVNGQWEDCKKPVGLMISLDDLRTAITNHNTDHCTDIRNHISPLTGVIER